MRKLLLLLIFLPLLIASDCDSKPNVAGGANLNPYWRAQELVKAGTNIRTPKGVKVYPEAGVSVDEQETAAIDSGLEKLFGKVRCNYADHPNAQPGHPMYKFEEWEVCLFVSEITPGGNVAFRVPVDGYRGTEWDQGGYVFAAGMVTGVVGESYTISLPDSKQGKYDQLRNGAEYEGEHWALATVDPNKYLATQIHGQGQGHPIIPDCGNSLVSPRRVPGLQLNIDTEGAGGKVIIGIIPVK